MIRKCRPSDLDAVARIWLNANLDAHSFVGATYWREARDAVRAQIAQAEVYVVEEDNAIVGFVGLVGDFLAGLFVQADRRSQGLGAELLSYVKNIKSALTLHAYKQNARAVAFYQREGFVIQEDSVDELGFEEYVMTWTK